MVSLGDPISARSRSCFAVLEISSTRFCRKPGQNRRAKWNHDPENYSLDFLIGACFGNHDSANHPAEALMFAPEEMAIAYKPRADSRDYIGAESSTDASAGNVIAPGGTVAISDEFILGTAGRIDALKP
jgi:hypothetical protein